MQRIIVMMHKIPSKDQEGIALRSYSFIHSPYFAVIKNSKALRTPKSLPLGLNKPMYFPLDDASTHIFIYPHYLRECTAWFFSGKQNNSFFRDIIFFYNLHFKEKPGIWKFFSLGNFIGCRVETTC